jgi:ATP-dependent Clp protease adaptor protein ClpS
VLVLDVEESIKIKKPSLYNIIILDDDITTAIFVTEILQSYFNKNEGQSYEHVIDIHLTGSTTLGSFSKDIAETKINLINEYTKKQGFPLQLKLSII